MTTTMNDEPEEKRDAKATRRRSIAIALLLVAMVAMFYAATIIRFGGNIAKQGM